MNGALPLAAGIRNTSEVPFVLGALARRWGTHSAACQNPSSLAVHAGPSSAPGEGEGEVRAWKRD